MIGVFVVAYILITLFIGVWAARKVKSSTDFMIAGKNLSFPVATATVFATWFGSETILGASSTFAEGGLFSVISDPFGAALCLILVGLFFARRLYRLNLLTFGDFYKVTYGPRAERIASICLVWSYLGWIAAQFIAMGLILHTLMPDIPLWAGISISAFFVTLYTVYGGMWSVSYTDFFQTLFIIAGLICVLVSVWNEGPGIPEIMRNTPSGFFDFFPSGGEKTWIAWLVAWITLGLGSIPQQDVFQRVMSSRTEKIAVGSSLTAGFLYVTIAFIPLLLGLAALHITGPAEDSQMLILQLVFQKTNGFVQVLFFGALLSAIMSTASGAILAPASIIGENLARPLLKKSDDARVLLWVRTGVIFVSVVSVGLAFSGDSIFGLVEEASEISLVSLFVPLVSGLFFKSRNEIAAVASMVFGLGTWIILYYFTDYPYPVLPATLISAVSFGITATLVKSSRPTP
jgi:solute:Na+ symporter, SSS family